MKLNVTLRSALLAVLFASALRAEETLRLADDTLLTIHTAAAAVVERGMTRDAVRFQLGAPTAELTADVWAYEDFQANGRPAGERRDVLLVVFAGENVTRLHLTEKGAVRSALARARAAARPAVVAAK